MTWIRVTVKTVHLLILLLVSGLALYNLGVSSQQSPPTPEKGDETTGALSVVQSDEQDQDGKLTCVCSDTDSMTLVVTGWLNW